VANHPFLLFTDGDNREQVVSLEPGMTLASVGRLSTSDVALSWDGQVSREHARLERVGEGWAVVDDGLSSNGTFVNGERISGRRPLSDGDAMQFGATTVTFRAPEDEAAVRTDPGAPVPEIVGLSTTQRRVLEVLCRPYAGGDRFAAPLTDQEIADELFLSPGAVRTHVAVMVAKFELDDLPSDQQRIRLAERAIQTGTV
jgi:FHA domain